MANKSISKRLMVGISAAVIAVFLLAVGSTMNAGAATAPGLGAADTYAVLAGSTVTNTGSSTIHGDVGVSPGSAVVGFPPGLVTNGTIHAADAHANNAQGGNLTAYNQLAGQPCDFNLTGQDLGGMTLTTGVYCFSTSAQLTGQLTLDAQGVAGAVFVFQIGSTLTTASNSSVLVINSGIDCNAFWQVGSSATLGTNTTFVGNVLALTSITLNTGASISGRALAQNGAVTLDTNHVGFELCALATDTPTATAAPTDTPTPAPTDTPPPTAAPTDTPPPPTPTPTPTPAPTFTATPAPPPTDTPIGETPAPTPTPTPVGQTPSPTASPTPVGQTPSPTPTPSPVGPTPTPTPTPSPTPTPTPTTSVTPTPTLVTGSPTPTLTTGSPTPTSVAPTSTPRGPLTPPEAPTNTPSITPGPGFPNTGGPPTEGGLPFMSLLLALTLAGLGSTAIVFGLRRKRVVAERADR